MAYVFLNKLATNDMDPNRQIRKISSQRTRRAC